MTHFRRAAAAALILLASGCAAGSTVPSAPGLQDATAAADAGALARARSSPKPSPTPVPSPRPSASPSPGTASPSPSAAPTPTPVASTTAPVIAGCQIFPADNAWNADVSAYPVDPNSSAYLASMNAGSKNLHPDFGSNPAYGIPYVVVGAGQPRVPVSFRLRR